MSTVAKSPEKSSAESSAESSGSVFRRSAMPGGRASRFLLTPVVFVAVVVFAAAVATTRSSAEEERLVFPEDPGRYIGPDDIAIDPAGEYLYVAERDAGRLRKVKADGSENATVLALPFEPERLRLFGEGKFLALVGGGTKGRLLVVDTKTMTVARNIAVGNGPSCVDVFSPTEPGRAAVAYVTNRFGGDVSVVDLETHREIRRVPFGREPIALAVTPDGNRLVVVPHLPEDKSIESVVSLQIRIYDTNDWSVRKVRLEHESVHCRDLVLSPDGRYAFIPCILGHFEHVTNQISNGWMFHNVVEVLDVRRGRFVDRIHLDDVGYGAANPWGIGRSPDGAYLAVACAGSCEVVLLNLPKILRSLQSSAGDRPEDRDDDYAGNEPPPRKLTSLEEALPVKLQVPTGQYGTRFVALHGRSVYFTAFFEDSLGRIDVTLTEPLHRVLGIPVDPKRYEFPRRRETPPDVPDRTDIPLKYETLAPLEPMQGVRFERYVARLGPAPELSQIRFGMLLFHDAVLCEGHAASCVSCHPDGRADTMNWDLLNDGVGNPKNTKSLLLSHETPPAMASGIRKNAETAVRSGFAVILFNERPENETAAVDMYLRSLRPVPSPRLRDGMLSEKARRGERLFHSPRSGCGDCHPAPLFTDLQRHDVGSWSYKDSRREFDTPTLIEVWRTSPYLHDGRYVTVEELIVEGKHGNSGGKLDRLSGADIDDLVEYVLSL